MSVLAGLTERVQAELTALLVIVPGWPIPVVAAVPVSLPVVRLSFRSGGGSASLALQSRVFPSHPFYQRLLTVWLRQPTLSSRCSWLGWAHPSSRRP